jgi:hypothetical protein
MSFALGSHPIVASDLNVTFKTVLEVSNQEFDAWAEAVRTYLAHCWVEQEFPPHDGTSLEEIERDMRTLSGLKTDDFLRRDAVTGWYDVIVSKGRSGAPLRSLFSNMSKSADGNGGLASIYEYLTADPATTSGAKLVRDWASSLDRIVRRDSMYRFSESLKPNTETALGASTGSKWVNQLREAGFDNSAQYWIEESNKEADGSELTLTRSDAYRLVRLGRISPSNIRQAATVDAATAANLLLGYQPGQAVFPWLKKGHFRIRPYEDARIFPVLFSMLRMGVTMQGVNFPARVAKFLYDRYGDLAQPNGKPIIVFDPSMGYGGRCFGALAAASRRPIHYVGTDPNTDNWIDLHRSRYEYLADFYKATVGQSHYATVEPYCCGSEVVRHDERFQQHLGKVDIAFTSPPYFCAEIYSREPTQSAIKFPTYPEWRDGFLEPTLDTCVEWLKPGGFLLWNIADIKIGGSYVPLEHDSLAILAARGMKLIEKLKMPLATAPGSGQLLNGSPTTKNFLKLNGTFRKYEPIYVFRKPSTI